MTMTTSIMNSSPAIVFRRGIHRVGDLAMAIRAFELTKLQYPKSYITVQSFTPELLRDHPAVDESLGMDDPLPGHDVFVDMFLRHNERKPKHQMFCEVTAQALESHGMEPIVWDGKPQTIWVTAVLRHWALGFVKQYTRYGKMPIGIFWRSEQDWRTWGRMKQLARMMANDGRFAVFCFDATQELEVDGAIQVVGMTLDKVSAILSCMKLVLTPDTAGVHLAGGLRIPCIAVFGATDPKILAGMYEGIVWPQVGCPHHPCWFEHRCLRAVCLREIKPGALYQSAISYYRGVRRHTVPELWDLPNTKPMEGQTTALVGRFRGIGDVGMLIFALEAYRHNNPNVHLTLITSPMCAALLCGQKGLVDDVIVSDYKHPARPGVFPLPIDTEGFDRVYNLINTVDFGSITQARPRADNFAHLLSTKIGKHPYIYPLEVAPAEIGWARDRINWKPGTKVILFQLDSLGLSRIWPTKHWLKLARYLANYYANEVNLVLVSIKQEHVTLATPRYTHNLSTETNVREYIALAAISDLVICADSSGLHVGGRTPTTQVLALMGSTGKIEGEWAHTNYYNNVQYIQSKMKCSPCWDWQHDNCSGHPHSPLCLWKIKPEEVFQRIKRILETEADSSIKSRMQCPKCSGAMVWSWKTGSASCVSCGFLKGGLDHIHFITNNIAIGNGTVPYDKLALKMLGIKAIITVANDFTQGHQISGEFDYARFDLHDSKSNNMAAFLEATEGLRDFLYRYDRVLVHCMGGGRRSVAVAAWLLADGDDKRFWRLIRDFKRVRAAVQLEGGIYGFLEEQRRKVE